MTGISTRDIVDRIDRLSSLIENTNINSASHKDDEKNDVKDAQTQEEEAEPSKVFGKGCVLNDDQDDAQRIIKTIIESDEMVVPKDEDKKDADGSDKKPCLIRMFKGEELDENFVYTDHDMVSIISRIVNENIDCFEIEEVQTATYERLKFFNEDSKAEAKSPGWEEIVHKTPIQELFSMIEFLREQARDTSELEDLPKESPSLDKNLLPEEPSQLTKTEQADSSFLAKEKSSGSLEATADLPSDNFPQKSGDPQLIEYSIEMKDEGVASYAGKRPPGTIAPMEGGGLNGLIEVLQRFSDGPDSTEPKKLPPSRPKVAPLDLSAEVKKKPKTVETPTSALPLPLSSRLNAALLSPQSYAKFRDAALPLEELYRRNGKDREKLERFLAAHAKDVSSKCGFIRSCDSALRPKSGSFNEGSATRVC
ncbi:hypothetical protein PGT21_022852 [Puccinia graminis f. sp. tritici]|uniref:Uncharacterized protein n=1 Tax=Puccinia graminis f. sp. tritici TaxID=56615 RepID=A0A5B0NEX6_PUCGR|nr:hypothetical protein PGT21_022852 [Puccinia graminis f. sp. tritici]